VGQKASQGVLNPFSLLVCNVAPSQLGDKTLFDFVNLTLDRSEKKPQLVNAVDIS
jgi:hypothetical protein